MGDVLTLLLTGQEQWWPQLVRHVQLSAVAIAISVTLGVACGAWLTRAERYAFAVVSVANLGRTVPSLAVLALAYPFLGTGFAPSVLALVALGVPPVLLGTYTGVREVDEGVREAARGMGLTGTQRLSHAELPMAAPVILSGIRTSSVQIVASASLAALIGGGGLGEMLLAGLTNLRYDMLVAGAVLVAGLAAATEVAFSLVERHALPAGIREAARPAGRGQTYRAGSALSGRQWSVALVACLAASAGVVATGSTLSGAVGGIGSGSAVGPLAAPGALVVGVTGNEPGAAAVGELYAQALEAQGHPVDRRFDLKSDEASGAWKNGDIDLLVADAQAPVQVQEATRKRGGPTFGPTLRAVDRLRASRSAAARLHDPSASAEDVAAALLASSGLDERGPRPTVRIGSKDFTEQFVLAELYAQGLEARGFRVERRFNLGATAVADVALRKGRIDVYPEYTGTALTAVLKRAPRTGATADDVYDQVARAYRGRGLSLLAQTPFSNGNAIVVTRETARRLKLRTIGDLARQADKLSFGAVPGFDTREDGLPLLERVYDLRFSSVKTYENALKYRALADGKVDAVYGFETDGPIARAKLVVLRDDKAAWPPYHVTPVVDTAFGKSAGPAFGSTLDYISSLLDARTMRRLNDEVERLHREPEDVARAVLVERGYLVPVNG